VRYTSSEYCFVTVLIFHIDGAAQAPPARETMSEGFPIANFRSIAHGLQEGQFAVRERKKALGLRDLDAKYNGCSMSRSP
jgi:hypothetical protein